MELVLPSFDYKKHTQVVHVKCRDSDVVINTLTFNEKILVEIADVKKQIFAVHVKNYGWLDHSNFYRMNDSGEQFHLRRTCESINLMPKCGVGFRDICNKIHVYDVETYDIIDCLHFKANIVVIRVVDEWLIVFIETAEIIVINYATKQRYISNEYNISAGFKLLVDKKIPFTFQDLIDNNWLSEEDIYLYIEHKRKKKHLISFSEKYVLTIKKNLLHCELPSSLVDTIIVPFFGF